MGLFDTSANPEAPISSQKELRQRAKKKLLDLVEPALKTIQECIDAGDHEDSNRLKAAFGVLDRAGFGIHSTITIDEKTDYSSMTREQLVDRCDAIKRQIAAQKQVENELKKTGAIH